MTAIYDYHYNYIQLPTQAADINVHFLHLVGASMRTDSMLNQAVFL